MSIVNSRDRLRSLRSDAGSQKFTIDEFRDSAERRIKSKLMESGDCLIWTGIDTDKDGYGRMQYIGKKVAVHRVAFDLWVGNMNDYDMILHHCDNPPCCKPGHLFGGNALLNAQDRDSKGRCRNKWSGRIA